jgi:transposase
MKLKQQSSQLKGRPDGKLPIQRDFSGITFFVGIDIHKKLWQVAVYSEGIILSNVSMESSAEKLISYLHKHYPGAHFSCVYESCAWGYSLCRTLRGEGIDCMIVNPADIPGTDWERRSKTDPVDARKLAKSLAAGLLRPIDVPSERLQKQRSLIRLRKRLWSDLVRAKNRLKSELVFQGFVIPLQFDNRVWSKAFLSWILQQTSKEEELKTTIEVMVEEVLHLKALIVKTERKLKELMQSPSFEHQSRLLRSIPGVGPMTTMLFLLEVGDVRRFKSFDALNRFVGLCPDMHSSGEKNTARALSARHHHQLRSILVEASWQLIRKDPVLLNQYKELTTRMKGQDAIIRIAKKLLRRMRAVLLSERIYLTGVNEPLTAAQLQAPRLPEHNEVSRSTKVKGKRKVRSTSVRVV